MRHFVIKVFNGLFFSHIFIAVCAVFSTIETIHLLHVPYFNSYYLLAVFCGTIVIYGGQALGGIKHANKVESNSVLWLRLNQKNILFLISLSLLTCVIVAINLPFKIIFALIITGIISIAYFISGLELRNKPFTKSLLVAIAWIFTTCIIPVLFFSTTIIQLELIIYAAKNTLFFYALCLIFDNRDVLIDRQQGVKTFASFYSTKTNNVIVYMCISVHLIIALYTKTFFIDCIVSIAAVLLAMRSLKNKSELFYLFYIDGLILLKALLVLCFI